MARECSRRTLSEMARLLSGGVLFRKFERFERVELPSVGKEPVRCLLRNLDPIVPFSYSVASFLGVSVNDHCPLAIDQHSILSQSYI